MAGAAAGAGALVGARAGMGAAPEPNCVVGIRGEPTAANASAGLTGAEIGGDMAG